MAYETVVATYDTPEHAKAAVDALKAGGFHSDDISTFDRARMGGGPGATQPALKQPGMWQRLFGGDMYKHEADVYNQSVQAGGTVVSVRTLDTEVAHATGILDMHHPVDVHDRAITSGIAPAAHVEAAAKEVATEPLAANQRIAASPRGNDEVLRLAEEQLQVGKEMVESGRTRVRRYTTERDVASDISLHEEHAQVMRRVLNEPATLTNVDWSDSDIEVTETAEHALVNKTARVVEQIELKKVGTDHVETIHDRLRRQQAEVVQVDAAGRPIAPRTN